MMPLPREEIPQHLALVKWCLARIGPIPTGLDPDDLLGAGQLALVQAAERYDETRGTTFSTYAREYIRGYMLNMIEEHNKQAQTGLETYQLEAAKPLQIRSKVSKRESRKSMSLTRVIAQTPDAAEVGAKVAALRSAVFGALTADRIAAVINKQLEQAEQGNIQSARLILGLVSVPSVTVQQVNVAASDTEEYGDGREEME